VTSSPDVLVIGGGIVGSATAYHLARRGASVTLLEANELAYGATGRNLGYIWVHTRRAGPELELVMHLRRELDGLPEELDAEFGLRMDGGLLYVHTEEQLATLREFVERRQADGVDIRLIDGHEARSLAPILPDTVIGASFCPLDAQMESSRYVRAFAAAAERAGATVKEGAKVRSFQHHAGRVSGVVTDDGEITPGSVVVAAGAWTPLLLEGLGVEMPIFPMRLQIVQTEPMERRLGPVLYGPGAVKQYLIFRELPSFNQDAWANDAEARHGKALLEAVCQRNDGSYLLGCAMDYPGFVWEPDLAGVALVAESLPAIMPALRGASFARAWAGVLPYTADNLPIVDAVPGFDNVYVAAGHVFGNGAGPTTGRLVADLICGGDPIMDMSPFRADRASLAGSSAGSVW
jgi:glycine/D-amino acid oxidase-like deaminating enzyme